MYLLYKSAAYIMMEYGLSLLVNTSSVLGIDKINCVVDGMNYMRR